MATTTVSPRSVDPLFEVHLLNPSSTAPQQMTVEDKLRELLLDAQMSEIHCDLQRAHAELGGFASEKPMAAVAAGYR